MVTEEHAAGALDGSVDPEELTTLLAQENQELRAEIEQLKAENAELRQIINQSQSSCSEEIREFEKKGWHGSSGYHAGLLKAAEIASEVEGRAMTKEQP